MRCSSSVKVWRYIQALHANVAVEPSDSVCFKLKPDNTKLELDKGRLEPKNAKFKLDNIKLELANARFELKMSDLNLKIVRFKLDNVKFCNRHWQVPTWRSTTIKASVPFPTIFPKKNKFLISKKNPRKINSIFPKNFGS